MRNEEADFQRLLLGIHKKKGRWPEDVLRYPFNYVFNRVLTPVERIITELRVEGRVNGEIAILLNSELKTVQRHIYSIRSKYRNQMNTRIDNHPVIRKTKGFIVRKAKIERYDKT